MTFFKFVNGILCNWESLCDIRPDCHHHFDASGTSNAMFDELAERSLMSPLAGMKHTYVRLAIIIYCQILALFFKFVNGILRNWESLCDIRPGFHHHFDASRTSNAMFDELAERSLMSPLAGTKHTYVRLAIIIYCQILALFFSSFMTLDELTETFHTMGNQFPTHRPITVDKTYFSLRSCIK